MSGNTSTAEFSGKCQIYTGDGKGKTTAALGLALRASGYGMRTIVVRFLKNDKSGELTAANPSIDFFTFGCDQMYRAGVSDCLIYRKYCTEALAFIRSKAFAGGYQIIICDEILYAFRFGLVSEEEILSLMNERPRDAELILTGNYLSPAIVEGADLVTELACVKHYYSSGVQARRGVEY